MLAALLRTGGRSDPFAPDTIVVQTPGVARWLSLRLADSLGCAMGLSYLFPRNFVDWASAEILGGEVPAHPDRGELAWRIFAVLPELARQPGAESLSSYLSSASPLRRRQLSLRLSDLFDSYLVFRPELVEAWDRGEEPGDWQAELWRRIAAGLPGRRLSALVQAIEDAATPSSFPRRIHLFALSTLPELYVRFLAVLGKHAEIHLFHFSPCEAYWGDLPGRRAEALLLAGGAARDFGQPLLSSMGQQGKDFLDLLLDAGFSQVTESFPAPSGPLTELSRLQEEIVRMKPRHEGGADASIEVVSCAGPMREVEVLKDRLLRYFREMPDLRPRDVLVLAPDISLYAPAVEAVFGAGDPSASLPFAVADGRAAALPAADAFLRLFSLALSRRTLRDILAFLEHPALAARFGMDAEAQAAVREILRETNVRWGLDGADREALGFGAEAANSWKAGLDSLALGAMMEPGAVFAGIPAYGAAEGALLETAAKLAGAYEAVRRAVNLFAAPRPLAEWPEALFAAAGLVLPEGDIPEGAGKDLVLRAVGSLAASAALAGPDPVDCRAVQDALSGILAESYSPPGFLSGAVTFAELKPMRSVPARVVCLLGLADADFPRQDRPLSFDRTTRERRRGDRSVREGDRYLFLETLLCARERLYLSFPGVSQQGAADAPASVLLAELLEFLSPGRSGGRIVRHPLQSFSRRYFSGGPLQSFSRMDFEAAQAGLNPGPVPAFFTREMAAETPALVDFADVVRYFSHPARAFALDRLGMRSPEDEGAEKSDEPLEIEAPERSAECERLVKNFLSGGDAPALSGSARARGILPWGLAGEAAAAEIAEEALVFSNALRPLVAEPARALEISFRMENAGVLFHGRLFPVHGSALVRVRTAKIRAADRLGLWLAALLAAAMREKGVPGASGLENCTQLFRDASLVITLPENASARLEALVALYVRGLSTPVPFFPAASLAFLRESSRSAKTPLERSLAEWTGGLFPEGVDQWNALLWRGRDAVSEASGFPDAARTVFEGYFSHAEEQAR